MAMLPTNYRPICVNHGCGRLVATDGKRWRVHCSSCQTASYGGRPHRPGVTPYKKGRCSNIDGHLGFPCLINWSQVPTWAKGMTEIDHKDGDHTNNHPTNLSELCPICHKLKGQRQGDYSGFRY